MPPQQQHAKDAMPPQQQQQQQQHVEDAMPPQHQQQHAEDAMPLEQQKQQQLVHHLFKPGQAFLPLPNAAATLINPCALLDGCYDGRFSATLGQWGLAQPYQRPSLAGQKRRRSEEPAESTMHQNIQHIVQAHQQLLALLHSSEGSAAARDEQTAPWDDQAHMEPTAAGAGVCAATESGTAAAAPNPAGADPAPAEQAGCDWRALAAMKHVLKPQIAFEYTDEQGQQQQVQSKLFGSCVHNFGSTAVLATAFDRQVLLPARSCFCMSELTAMQPFVPAVKAQGCADLLVIDPPWENASAKRAAHYDTLTPNHLLYVPVQQLLKQLPGSLVALWMTNRPRHHRFVLEKLLPAWGLCHTATWFWLKVADGGEAVSPLSSLHRHPFEQVWLARVGKGVQAAPAAKQEPGADGQFQSSPAQCPDSSSELRQAAPPAAAADVAAEPPAVPPLPDRHVLMSVPGQHSRKPHLRQLLEPFVQGSSALQQELVVAELFARELFPGCMAWGNEALKFQEVGVFWDAQDVLPIDK